MPTSAPGIGMPGRLAHLPTGGLYASSPQAPNDLAQFSTLGKPPTAKLHNRYPPCGTQHTLTTFTPHQLILARNTTNNMIKQVHYKTP